MRFCVDMDGTVCTQERNNLVWNYNEAKPNRAVISAINRLYKRGDYIIIFTARGSTTKIDWGDVTKKQLSSWGVKYHELIFGKPEADFYIDDRGMSLEDFSRYTS